MAHAATSLSWAYGEVPAVVTSIGPGALQAMAGSLAAASNGVGLYHIYGDETTFGEGYNMQQVPKREQHIYGQITALMGQSYVLHTPEALRDALRRGSLSVFHPYRRQPFYLLLPINKQPAMVRLTLTALPGRPELPAVAPIDERIYADAVGRISRTAKVAIKAGGGTRGHDAASNGWPKRPAQVLSCRRARPACCRIFTRRTCTSEDRRARSPATTP